MKICEFFDLECELNALYVVRRSLLLQEQSLRCESYFWRITVHPNRLPIINLNFLNLAAKKFCLMII